MRQLSRFVLATAVGLSLVACGGGDARALWKEALKRCANSDLLGPNVLYLGPSNGLGPGTVFEPFRTGGTQESHLIDSYVQSPATVISPKPQTFTCAADRATKMSLSADLPLDAALPVGAQVGANLKRAKTIKVTADELRWVSLLTGAYKEAINNLPDSHQVKQDIQKNGHLVLSRALQVKGLKAELEFASDVGADVKAKVPNVSGEKDIKLGGAWEGTTKLTITSSSDFFIAGELRKWEEGGLAASEIGTLILNVANIKVLSKR